MLSFTEFFTKKKIDLKALQIGRPDLYQEFDRDYALMGEKSFDHSKKFWFNRLRKDYLLQEIEISESKKTDSQADVTKKEATVVHDSASTDKQETPVKVKGFTPRFKASGLPKKAEETKEQEDKATASQPESTSDAQAEKAEPATKPKGFTPRFKAGNLPKKVLEEKLEKDSPSSSQPEATSDAQTEKAEPAAKPKGFTPRFKASNLPKKVEEEKVNEEKPSEEKIEVKDTKENIDTPVSKPAGFKPRFKAGVTKTNTTQDIPDTHSEQNTAQPKEPSTPTTSKPVGFKPRFAAKKSPDQNDKEE
jgi:hypothetical protein